VLAVPSVGTESSYKESRCSFLIVIVLPVPPDVEWSVMTDSVSKVLEARPEPCSTTVKQSVTESSSEISLIWKV